MRLSRAGACVVVAGVYLVLRFAMPMAGHGLLNPHLAVFLSVAVIMMMQLALVVGIAGLRIGPRSTAFLAVLTAVLLAGTVILLARIKPIASAAVFDNLAVLQDLFLMLFAAFLGYTVSFIVREPSLLLPVAVFAALVDYWSVSWGPLSHVIENKPSVVAAASVHMPTPVPGVPGTMIGMGDFVFLALFFAVLFRFGMNVRGAFWLGYILLTASMLVVLKLGGALPALLPMGVAVIATNMRFLKLKRDELLATLYVGAMLLVLLVASRVFLFWH